MGGANTFGAPLQHMDVDTATLTFVLTVALVLCLELCVHRLDHAVQDTAFAAMLASVYKEMMLLGLVGFLVFTITNMGVKLSDDVVASFDFAHFSLLFVGVFYAFQAAFVMLVSDRVKTLFFNTSNLSVSHILSMARRSKGQEDSDGWEDDNRSVYVRRNAQSIMEIKILERLFKYAYGLPREFDFGQYMSLSLEVYITQLLDVTGGSWLAVVVVIGLNWLRVYAQDQYSAPGMGALAKHEDDGDDGGHFDDDDHGPADDGHGYGEESAPGSVILDFFLAGIVLVVVAASLTWASRVYECRLIAQAGVLSEAEYEPFLCMIEAEDLFEEEARLTSEKPDSPEPPSANAGIVMPTQGHGPKTKTPSSGSMQDAASAARQAAIATGGTSLPPASAGAPSSRAGADVGPDADDAHGDTETESKAGSPEASTRMSPIFNGSTTGNDAALRIRRNSGDDDWIASDGTPVSTHHSIVKTSGQDTDVTRPTVTMAALRRQFVEDRQSTQKGTHGSSHGNHHTSLMGFSSTMTSLFGSSQNEGGAIAHAATQNQHRFGTPLAAVGAASKLLHAARLKQAARRSILTDGKFVLPSATHTSVSVGVQESAPLNNDIELGSQPRLRPNIAPLADIAEGTDGKEDGWVSVGAESGKNSGSSGRYSCSRSMATDPGAITTAASAEGGESTGTSTTAKPTSSVAEPIKLRLRKRRRNSVDPSRSRVSAFFGALRQSVLGNADAPRIKTEEDISDIFFLRSPQLYDHAVRILLLLNCFYLAIWLTTFATTSTAAAAILLSTPSVIVTGLLTLIVKRSAVLHAVATLRAGVVAKVVQTEEEHERALSALRDRVNELASQAVEGIGDGLSTAGVDVDSGSSTLSPLPTSRGQTPLRKGQSLSRAGRNTLAALFHEVDVARSGYLTCEEFVFLSRKLGLLDFSRGTALLVFGRIDVARRGRVDVVQLCKAVYPTVVADVEISERHQVLDQRRSILCAYADEYGHRVTNATSGFGAAGVDIANRRWELAKLFSADSLSDDESEEDERASTGFAAAPSPAAAGSAPPSSSKRVFPAPSLGGAPHSVTVAQETRPHKWGARDGSQLEILNASTGDMDIGDDV